MQEGPPLVENWILLVVITALGFLFRSYFRIRNRQAGIDSWYHLLAARKVWESRFHLPKSLESFVSDERYDYPPILHFLLALIPQRYILSVSPFLSPLMDTLHSVVAFLVVFSLLGSFPLAVAAQLAYLLTPRLTFETFTLGPRPLGSLFVTLCLLSFYGYVSSLNIVFAVLSSVFAGLTYLAHRFSLQALFFLAILFPVFDIRYAPLLPILGLGFILALLLSRLHYTKVLQGHLSKLNFFRTHPDESFGPKDIKTGESVRTGVRTYLHVARMGLLENPWSLFSVWYLLLASGLFVFGRSTTTALAFFGLWSVLLLALGVVTFTVRSLRFLGDGWKYLNLSGLPTSVLISLILFDSDASLGIVMYALCAVASFLFILSEIRSVENGIDYRTVIVRDDMKRCLNYIKDSVGDGILCIPITFNQAAAFFCGKRVLLGDQAQSTAWSQKFDMALHGGNLINGPLYPIVTKYSMHFILIHGSFLNRYDLSFAREVFSSGDLHVYRTSFEGGMFLDLVEALNKDTSPVGV